MVQILRHFILVLLILVFFSGCDDECNDCLELTTKNVVYLDANGSNLLFGDQAIYNPDSVEIRASNNDEVSVWKEEDTGSIMFNLGQFYNSYHIFLSASIIDTLQFELAERKSEQCCGNVTYSTKTFLNGLEIENNDLITIMH